jgi:predicted ATP-grasp superfamily ATP-dependent carboligase
MTILIVEYLTATARPGADARVIAEGRAMRDAVVADFLRLRGVKVVLLGRPEVAMRPHPRLRQLHPRADWFRQFRSQVVRADAVLVIAPERGGLLARLSRIVEEEDRLLLGPSSPAVRLATDKAEALRLVAAAGLRVPRTELLPLRRARAALRSRRLPFVVKPRDGFGTEGVFIVRRTDQIDGALAAIRGATRRKEILIQEVIDGEPASVSVIVGEAGHASLNRRLFLPLGLNRQRLIEENGLIYVGGVAGWRHPMERAAMVIACEALLALGREASGWRGYVGVDLILGRGGVSVLEVNPRITTSYIGLRRVVCGNLAGLMRSAVLGGPFANRARISGSCRFDCAGSTWVRQEARRRGAAPVGRRGRTWWSFSAGTLAAPI